MTDEPMKDYGPALPLPLPERVDFRRGSVVDVTCVGDAYRRLYDLETGRLYTGAPLRAFLYVVGS